MNAISLSWAVLNLAAQIGPDVDVGVQPATGLVGGSTSEEGLGKGLISWLFGR